jgi:subtilase family serine protease
MPVRLGRPSRKCLALAATATIALAAGGAARAADQAGTPMITHAIDEARTIVRDGNVRPEVAEGRDLGKLADSHLMAHLQLQLQRSPEKQAALDAYVDSLNNRGAANFHKWLTPAELDSRFGINPHDFAVVTSWLKSHGMTIHGYSPNLTLDVSATVGQLRAAFGVDMHRVEAKGELHVVNVNDPTVPEALTGVLLGPVSLSDFRPHTNVKKHLRASPKQLGQYTYTSSGTVEEAIVPGDLQTIYNLTPLYAQGITGTGQTVVVVEDTDLYSIDDWYTFRKVLGLTRPFPNGTLTVSHPTGPTTCTAPGVNSADGEAALDVEWASAAAPNAAIVMAACKDGTVFGGFIALSNILAQTNHPNIVSISYGESETILGATTNAYINTLYQTAVAEGVSVFVSSGDEGATSADANATYARYGITSSGFATPQYDVAVGGTDFADTYLGTNANYWSATNNPNTFASALSYIPEIPWNDTCASGLFDAQLYAAPPVAGIFTGSISGTTLTVTAVAGGYAYSGETISGTGIAAGTKISANQTGAGGTGKYTVSISQTVASTTIDGSIILASATAAAACNNALLVAEGYTYTGGGSGGPSTCATGAATTRYVTSGTCKGYAKPSWQSLVGNPADAVRDIPDVSLFASNGFWNHYFVYCYSDPTANYGGEKCVNNPSAWSGAGGTSFSSPIMAAIQSLVNEKTGQHWGNPNPIYYSMAATEYGSQGSAICNSEASGGPSSSCTFYDVTLGDMADACRKNGSTAYNCYLVGTNTYGAESTSNSALAPQSAGAYGTTTGWDFSTGIGTINAYNFVNNPAW